MGCRFLPERFRRSGPCAIAYLVLSAVLIAGAAACRKPGPNLIVNGNIATGSGLPDGWHASPDADCSALSWLRPDGAGGELRIFRGRRYETGSWYQQVSLRPGWYQLSAQVRAEDAGVSGGAAMAVKLGGLSGAVMNQSASWQLINLYFKVASQDSVAIECRLNSPAGRSKAFFRDIRLVKVSGSPPANSSQFDFEKMQGQWSSEHSETPDKKPISYPWWMIAETLALCATFALFWFWLKPTRGVPLGQSGSRSVLMHAGSSGLPDASTEPAPDRTAKVGVACFFAGILVFIFAMTWTQWIPGAGFKVASPIAVWSDEPYYVMVINSILFDHDLELQDDFRRVKAGGLEAGVQMRGIEIDHQTIVVNRRTRHHKLGGAQTRDFTLMRCNPEFDPASPDVYEVSAHPAAWPALLALAVAPVRPTIGDVERDAAIVLALISWLTALFTYLVARRDGMGRAPAMTAVLILVAASPWLAYSRSFFPECGIALALIVCLWAWIDERTVAAAAAAAVAAILTPTLAVVGAGIILEELRRGRRREAIEAGAVLGVSGLALCAFNYWLARTPVIASVRGWRQAQGFGPLLVMFLDPGHGLVIFVPWAIIALVAIAREAVPTSSDTRMLPRMAIPITLYLILLAWYGGGPAFCYGPRYWVPFLPWMALATVDATRKAGRPALLACGVLVLLGAAIAVPGALRYPQLFSLPPSAAWKGW